MALGTTTFSRKLGVPAGDLGVLARGLGHGALSEALDGSTRSLAYPAALGPLAQGGFEPLVAEPEPQDQPHRGRPGVGEQEAGYARLGDTVLVVCCGRAHLSLLSFLVAFSGAICTPTLVLL